MKIGILGLPGCGKSTLFDLLTECFDGPDFSASQNKPRIRTVKVTDPRLERLRDDYAPKKYTPASLEVLDFPAMRGEGDRAGLADLLAPARELEALLIVCRDFATPGLPDPDPAADLAEIRGEFILADLVIVENRLERLEARSKKPNFTDDDRREVELLGKIRVQLEAEKPVAHDELSADEVKRLSGFGLLSSKRFLVAVNRGDGGTGLALDALRSTVDVEVLEVSARNELEILQLDSEEQVVFLEEYGIESLSREPLIAAAYRTAGRISFFTAGDKEVRAWTIRDGEPAVEAAEEIHSDIARGFIRAEIVSYDDYVACGNIKAAKEKGLLRLEGKEYTMADGDIVEFRFSV